MALSSSSLPGSDERTPITSFSGVKVPAGPLRTGSVQNRACIFLSTSTRLPYNRPPMEEPARYQEKLDAAIESRRQWLEAKQIPRLRDALASFEALFEGAM